MKKIFTYKFLISILFIIFCFTNKVIAQNTFVSLSPSATEIIYAINAQDQLLGVSTTCTYPKIAQNKPKIGNTFFIDKEKILKLNPNYILAPDSTAPMLSEFKYTKIEPLCYKYKTIEDIYSNILSIGKLADKQTNAQRLVRQIQTDINNSKTKQPKRVLYLVQIQPMITIGNQSFISDVIKKSGQISVTSNLNSYYPTISEEYAIKSKPDVIVVSFYSDTKFIKKLFPNTKIIFMTQEQNDIINRPGARIHKSIQFFANL